MAGLAERIRRWELRATDEGVEVCNGDHHQTCACRFTPLSPEDLVDIINELREEVLEKKDGL